MISAGIEPYITILAWPDSTSYSAGDSSMNSGGGSGFRLPAYCPSGTTVPAAKAVKPLPSMPPRKRRRVM